MVAFVDDEVEVLNAIRRLLEFQEVEWDLLFFTDPQAALHDRDILSCDVVVSDLRMPGLSGMDLLKALRHRGLDAAMIILTGTGDMGAALEAINEIKVFRFYLKPCPQQRLVDGISEAIAQRRANLQAADLLPFAVIALDDLKRVTFMNKDGAALVNGGKVIVLDGGGHCRAATPGDTVLLHTAIESFVALGEPIVLGLNDKDGETRYSFLIDHAAGSGGGATVFLFIMDPQKRRPPSVEALKQLFDLSNSEARLAHGLAQGLDIREVADSLDITVQTARTYLKTLFEKTSTNRQAELVRTLITAVPQVRGGL